jgi:O-succinylbenzoic acid--CoA ligase
MAFRDRVVTFGELDRLVGRAAAELRGMGVEVGHCVGLLARNSIEFVVAVHAVARMGAILAPFNVRLTPVELSWQLRDAGVRLLLHDDANAAAAAATGAQTTVLPLHRLSRSDFDGQRMDGGPIHLGRVQGIVYTSGTTGTPKAAQLTFGNWWFGASASALHLGHDPADRWLAALPLFHVGGLAILYRSVIGGIPVTLQDGFDGDEAIVAIERDRVTLVSLVEATLDRLVAASPRSGSLASLRVALLGGGPAAPSLVDAAVARGVPVAPTYGLTEAASQVATLPPGDAVRLPGCVGWSLPHVEVRVERDGGALSPGAEGEIAIRGPGLMRGYRGAEPLRPGAWFRTGDIGRLDESNRLYVLDRRNDLIVSGGENVYPAEVEAALLRHPSVDEAAVVGMPDHRWGSVPVGYLVMQPGAVLDEQAVLSAAGEVLAPFKRPRRLIVVDALPRNAGGKVVRRLLPLVDRSAHGSDGR